MARGRSFNLSGADALYATLAELPRATQRNVLDRTLREVIKPFAAKVQAGAPYFTGTLQEHLITGPHRLLNTRQKRLERQGRGKFEATIHFGTSDPAGIASEFGNFKQKAKPFFRGEWEAEKMNLLRGIEERLGPQIVAAAERAARKNKARG